MGRLADDMTRLVGEIHAARDGRGRLMRDLKHATVEMKKAVAGTQARFRSAHADMARRQQRMLRDFASHVRVTVAGRSVKAVIEVTFVGKLGPSGREVQPDATRTPRHARTARKRALMRLTDLPSL